MKLLLSILATLLCFNNFCFSENFETSHFHVMTVASKPHDGLNRLLTSCHVNHIPIEIVGFGIDPWPGNGQKLFSMKRYLENIPDDHIVMFVDAFDTFILATKEQILQKFLEKNTRCIFCAEKVLWPNKYEALFPKSPTSWKYLNSGSYIGYAGYLKQMLQEMEPFQFTSDQAQFIKYYVHHKQDILLDYNTEFFLSLHALKFKDLIINKEKKSVQLRGTASKSFIIHGAGHGKSLYEKIYNSLFEKNKKGEETK